jgi:predicted transcriptional regulator
VFEKYDAVGRVESCRPDPADARDVICTINVWTRWKWPEVVEAGSSAAQRSERVVPSSYPGGGFVVRGSTRRPESCPSGRTPPLPCDPYRCPIVDPFAEVGRSRVVPSILPEVDRSEDASRIRRPGALTTPSLLWGDREFAMRALAAITPLSSHKRVQLGGLAGFGYRPPELQRPDLALAHRLLRILAEANTDLPPTRLAAKAHTNYTQVERYMAWFEVNQLVQTLGDASRRRWWIHLTTRGRLAAYESTVLFSAAQVKR